MNKKSMVSNGYWKLFHMGDKIVNLVSVVCQKLNFCLKIIEVDDDSTKLFYCKFGLKKF